MVAGAAAMASGAEAISFYEPAIAPDGKTVAWVQGKGTSEGRQLYVGEKPVRTAAESHRDESPEFSPDGKTIAFFSNAGSKGQAQLWTVAVGAGAAKKRTQVKGFCARPKWSPDGQAIAFLYIEGGDGGGPLMAAQRQTGVIEAEVKNQRIAVLDLKTGKVRMGSPAELHVYDFDWAPDSKRVVMTAAPGPGDNNWWIAKLYVGEAGGEAKAIYAPKWQIAIPRWSPDGATVAFIEGIMSDEGFHGGDLMTVHPDGTGLANRTQGRKKSVNSLMWSGADTLMLAEYAGGGTELTRVSLRDNTFAQVFRGEEGLHAGGNFPNLALSRDGSTSVAVRSDFTTPPEVWMGAPGKWKALTSANGGLSARSGKAESVTWQSDGYAVQGWLLPPQKVEAGRKYPMIVSIHGGPANMVAPAWPGESSLTAALTARGYFVFLPNPRGSYGQGEAFTQANVKDFGGGDLRDVLQGVDRVVAKHPVDPQRLGLTGWSYGGYMTMWTVTQTNRFRAAMAGAGIANWKSYYGQNLIDRWMIPFFGASVYDDPAVYAKSSPMEFIKQVKTPVLVLVGERDAECPAPQSFEFWHALRTLGVSTELVVYAGEGHMFQEEKNRKDMLARTIGWFEKYLR